MAAFHTSRPAANTQQIEADFYRALWAGEYHLMDQALREGANPSQSQNPLSQSRTPLTVAAFRNWDKAMHLLRSYGADPTVNSASLWKHAVSAGPRAFFYLMDWPEAKATLHQSVLLLPQAAGLNHIKIVRALLKEGMNVHQCGANGQQAIHHAAYNDNIELLKLLIEHGADPSCKDINGSQPMHSAAYTQSCRALRYLKKAGADLHAATDTGAEPIHWACISYWSNSGTAYSDAIRFLALRGGNLDLMSKEPFSSFTPERDEPLDPLTAARIKKDEALLHFLNAELSYREKRALQHSVQNHLLNEPYPQDSAHPSASRIKTGPRL